MFRPISTYGGRGVANPSVLKWEHCMVYTDRHPPELLPGEAPGHGEQPMRAALQVKPSTPGDRMEDASRLNYGKMYTVEHNVRVYDFGMVRSEYIPILTGEWGQIVGYSAGQKRAQNTSTSAPLAAPAPVSSSLPVYADYGYAKDDLIPPAGDDRQIPLEENDRLAIIFWPFEGWARAYNERSRETGIVPITYISLYPTATALYDWSPPDEQSHEYIEIESGDDIRVIDNSYAGWATVWNRRTAYTGLVPSNYFTLSAQR